MTTVGIHLHKPPTTQVYGARLESLLLDEQFNEILAGKIPKLIGYGSLVNIHAVVKDIKAEGSFVKSPALWMLMSDFLEQMSAEIDNWRPTVAGYSADPDTYRMLHEYCQGLERACRRLDDLLNRLTS